MMTSTLIAALFASGAAFAVASIAATLRAYWPAVLALREGANWLPEEQNIMVTTTAICVTTHGGMVLRPDFSGRSRSAVHGLRAAA
jgi:hypothetical protein